MGAQDKDLKFILSPNILFLVMVLIFYLPSLLQVKQNKDKGKIGLRNFKNFFFSEREKRTLVIYGLQKNNNNSTTNVIYVNSSYVIY